MRPTLATRLQELDIKRHEESFPSTQNFRAELTHVRRQINVDKVLLVGCEDLRSWDAELHSHLENDRIPYDLVLPVGPNSGPHPIAFPGTTWVVDAEGLTAFQSVVEFSTFLLSLLPNRMLAGIPNARCFSTARVGSQVWQVKMMLENADPVDNEAGIVAKGLLYDRLFNQVPRRPEQVVSDLISSLTLEPQPFSSNAHIVRSNLSTRVVPQLLQSASEICPDWRTFRDYLSSLGSELRVGKRPLLGAALETILCEFPEEPPEIQREYLSFLNFENNLGTYPILSLGNSLSRVLSIREAHSNLFTRVAADLVQELRQRFQRRIYKRLSERRAELEPEEQLFLVLPTRLSVDFNEEVWTQTDLCALISMRPIGA
ncbi:MAG: hypothetical protein JWO13_1670 [Acidobacteriales bacterium]|nr:hypothetical protein [Terriglobales bacterium]